MLIRRKWEILIMELKFNLSNWKWIKCIEVNEGYWSEWKFKFNLDKLNILDPELNGFGFKSKVSWFENLGCCVIDCTHKLLSNILIIWNYEI